MRYIAPSLLAVMAILAFVPSAGAQNTIYARDVPGAREKPEPAKPEVNSVQRVEAGKSQYNSPQGSLKSLHTQEPDSGASTTMNPDVEQSVNSDIQSTTGTNPDNRLGTGGVDTSVGGGGLR